ncbi:MAG: glucose-phosphate thymidyltransferase [Actinomycetia bacterium]|nr:glucose-phosphate thymidyltransferase [Actinomycetes bacterium]
MKALVLAGGSGTRLRPITYTSAKQLVPLANRPILFFGLEAIAASGITEVGIIVGETHQAIRDVVGDGSELGIKATFIQQDAPKGLAHAVLIAKEFLGDEPFVMYLGDNLVVGGITAFVEEFTTERPDAMVLLTKVDNPQSFGVAELAADGSLVRLVEKPKNPPSDLALVGVYLFDSCIHEAVRAIKPSGRGELEITDAIQWLIENGRTVRPHILTSPWIDTGKLQDLLEANRIVLDAISRDIRGDVDDASRVEGKVVVAEGAVVRDSTIRGPAVIGAGAHIERTFVGPFSSVGNGCRLVDAEIEHSVVLDRAEIDGVQRIVDSLIGRDAKIVKTSALPAALRLMIGDDSEISIPL